MATPAADRHDADAEENRTAPHAQTTATSEESKYTFYSEAKYKQDGQRKL